MTPPIKEYNPEGYWTHIVKDITLPTVKGIHYETVVVPENDESDLYNYFRQDHKLNKSNSSISLEAHETLEIPTLLQTWSN